MSKIPTAEEFLKDKFKQIYRKQPEGFTSKIPESRYLDLHVTGRIDGREQNYPEMMIEFAKLHVKAALKDAYNNVEIYNKSKFPGDINYQADPDSILNAYPLTNIK